uniref:Uncharacterized protein n=1 Tax=Romanomermis culicivorax TaxID=13658 RepID=A0A915LCH4_ROMCU
MDRILQKSAARIFNFPIDMIPIDSSMDKASKTNEVQSFLTKVMLVPMEQTGFLKPTCPLGDTQNRRDTESMLRRELQELEEEMDKLEISDEKLCHHKELQTELKAIMEEKARFSIEKTKIRWNLKESAARDLRDNGLLAENTPKHEITKR